MNIVEFAFKFKDMASTPLRQFGEQSRKTWANVKDDAYTALGKNKALGQSYDELRNKIKAVENTIGASNMPGQIRAARKELESLQKLAIKHKGNTDTAQSGKGAGSGIVGGGLSLLKTAGIAGVAYAGYQAGKLFKDSAEAALNRQKIQVSFDVLAGSNKAGAELTRQLVKFQKDTILGPEVFENAQKMLGANFKDTEVLPNLKMLGDVSMGDADKLGRLTLAFSQTKGAGKLNGEDLNQYINAGFNPLQEMAKRTGKTYGQLRADMEKGNISFDMVQQSFKDATSEGGRFNNMLATIAKTPFGKAQQLSGAWEEFKISAGTAFMPLISGAIEFGTKMLPIIEQFIKPLANGIATFMGYVQQAKPYVMELVTPFIGFIKNLTSDTAAWMGYLEPIRVLFVESIWPAVKKLTSGIYDIVGKLVDFIKRSTLIKNIFKDIASFIGTVVDIIGFLIDGLVWVFDHVVMPILNGIEAVYKFFSGGEKKVTVTTVGKMPVILKKGTAGTEDTNTNASLIGENTKAVKDNTESAKNTEDKITSGGPKVINYNIGKFLDNIVINSVDLHHATTDVERTIIEMFSRILAQGAIAK